MSNPYKFKQLLISIIDNYKKGNLKKGESFIKWEKDGQYLIGIFYLFKFKIDTKDSNFISLFYDGYKLLDPKIGGICFETSFHPENSKIECEKKLLNILLDNEELCYFNVLEKEYIYINE